jgi:hypothetical protein
MKDPIGVGTVVFGVVLVCGSLLGFAAEALGVRVLAQGVSPFEVSGVLGLVAGIVAGFAASR